MLVPPCTRWSTIHTVVDCTHAHVLKSIKMQSFPVPSVKSYYNTSAPTIQGLWGGARVDASPLLISQMHHALQ